MHSLKNVIQYNRIHKAQRDEEQTSKNKMKNSDIYRNYT